MHQKFSFESVPEISLTEAQKGHLGGKQVSQVLDYPPWTVDQALLPLEFSSNTGAGCALPPPKDLPSPKMELMPLAPPSDIGTLYHWVPPDKPAMHNIKTWQI